MNEPMHRVLASHRPWSTAVRLAIILCLAGLCATAASATSYVMPTDQNLIDKSGLVVIATMEGVENSPGRSIPAAEYQFRVEQVLKGFVLATDIVVRVPGGLDNNGHYYKIHGTPTFEQGQRAILFLNEEDGAFRVADMQLGAFLEGGIGNTRHAYRSVTASAIPSDNDPLAAQRQQSYLPRDFDRFSQWISDAASGVQRPADYFLEPGSADGLIGVREEFRNIVFGCPQGNSIARWRQFDEGGTVGYRAFSGGQPGVAGGGFNDVSRAIQAWNGVAASKVELRYQGTTNNNVGGTSPPVLDRLNRVVWEDPNGVINGSFVANQGGTLAVTVVITDCVDVRPFGNTNETRIIDADIITQDGVGANYYPNQPPQANERVITHEFGHALGLSHSCGDGSGIPCSGVLGAAIMNPSIQNPALGRTLGTDDKRGIRFIYPSATGGGNAPTAPTDLVATPVSMNEIQLTWKDNSSDETSFSLQERALTSTVWTDLATLAAGTTAVVHENLDPKTARVYRIAATNNAGTSEFSNEAQATSNGPIGPCVSDATTLCIQNDQFEVTTRYLDQAGNSGVGNRNEITSDTGYFYFFSAANVEMVVKVLDVCDAFQRFWVFAGGLTDQQVELIVTDTETGRTNTYFNPLKTPFEPIQDTQAFATCP